MEKYLALFTPIADAMGVNIVDMDLIGNDLLEVAIARKDFEPVDLELCAVVADALGTAIDFEIGLDVGSAGAERLINPEDYGDMVNQYVHIEFKTAVLDADYVEGMVEAIDDHDVVVSYKVKTATKKVTIALSNIKMLRLAVNV